MEITLDRKSNSIEVFVKGRLDTTMAPELEKALVSEMEGLESLVLDFANLEYISSAGLRVLLGAQKRMNRQGEMKVRNANEDILEIFEVTGFADILNIE